MRFRIKAIAVGMHGQWTILKAELKERGDWQAEEWVRDGDVSNLEPWVN